MAHSGAWGIPRKLTSSPASEHHSAVIRAESGRESCQEQFQADPEAHKQPDQRPNAGSDSEQEQEGTEQCGL